MSLQSRILIICMVFSTAISLGCVRRRLTLMSDPPGAVVSLDKVEIGKTPISCNFEHYGNRELRLVKEGYETHTQMISLRAPWYQWAGLDFVSEVLVPHQITDRKTFRIKMRPQKAVSPDDLIAQAEHMKSLAHSSGSYRIDRGRPNTAPGSTPYGEVLDPPPIPDAVDTEKGYFAPPGRADAESGHGSWKHPYPEPPTPGDFSGFDENIPAQGPFSPVDPSLVDPRNPPNPGSPYAPTGP